MVTLTYNLMSAKVKVWSSSFPYQRDKRGSTTQYQLPLLITSKNILDIGQSE